MGRTQGQGQGQGGHTHPTHPTHLGHDMDWCSWSDLLSTEEMEGIARKVGLIGPDGGWHWDGGRVEEFERRCDDHRRAKLLD